MFKHFQMNDAGRDFVVGDIHGCFSLLASGLAGINFNESKDRLFSVGDLVDRGAESESCLDWLGRPWFHAVRGNHEQMAIDYCNGIGDADLYVMNGGAWMVRKSYREAEPFIAAFKNLPIAIDVQTSNGLVGIVHADCPTRSWGEVEARLSDNGFRAQCIWSRDRANNGDCSRISGVEKVVVGHTPMKEDRYMGNVHYIDTGAVFGRKLTIIQIN